MRLDKYLAETAQCTRSEAKTMLAKGRVQVNGAVCKKGDTQLKDTDTVAVDGALLTYQKFVYLMLNKPEGVVSASTDKRDTTVVDLVGDAYPRRELFPAGRLDKTSTGFVLLTDDGGFAHDILSPPAPCFQDLHRDHRHAAHAGDAHRLCGGGHAGRRHCSFARRGDRPFPGRMHRAGSAAAGGVPPDQTDVRCVRCRGECFAPGGDWRPCTGCTACPGAVAGAF